MRKLKLSREKLNAKGFSHVEAFIVVVVIAVLAGIGFYVYHNNVSHAGSDQLRSIDFYGQIFYVNACRTATNRVDIQLTVNRPAGLSTVPSYNPIALGRNLSTPAKIPDDMHDDWHTSSSSTISFPILPLGKTMKNFEFKVGIEGKISGQKEKVYGPNYSLISIILCSARTPKALASNTPWFWPFATKSTSQFNRVDQGWDIQTVSGGAIYAIASGNIYLASPDPTGFGNNYPIEQLDHDLGIQSDWIYYGHVHILASLAAKIGKNGVHVATGQLIAYSNTYHGENGSQAPPGWLEIGFAVAGTGRPIAQVEPGDNGEGASTTAGWDMHNLLIGVSVDK